MECSEKYAVQTESLSVSIRNCQETQKICQQHLVGGESRGRWTSVSPGPAFLLLGIESRVLGPLPQSLSPNKEREEQVWAIAARSAEKMERVVVVHKAEPEPKAGPAQG